MTGKYTTLDRELKPAIEAHDPAAYIATVKIWKNARLLKPLAVACFYGHVEMAELLLQHGINPNQRNRLKWGETPLHIAVEKENVMLVKVLARYGARLIPNHRGETPLEAYERRKRIWKSKTEAQQQVEAEIRRILADLEALAPEPDLFDAAIHGDDKSLHALLEDGGFAVDETDIEETTPLMAAVTHGQLKCAEMLLAYGANANHVAHPASGHEITPLFCAIDKHHASLVKLLLAHGADANVELDFDLCTPLMRTLRNYRTGDLDIVALLLEAGADVNHIAVEDQDLPDSTPLHYAVDIGEVEVVELLLRYGADKDSKNRDGEKPIDFLTYSEASKVTAARIRILLTPGD